MIHISDFSIYGANSSSGTQESYRNHIMNNFIEISRHLQRKKIETNKKKNPAIQRGPWSEKSSLHCHTRIEDIIDEV